MLFEQESLRGHSPEGTAARESASADAQGSAGGSAGFLYGQGVKVHGIGYEEERAPTLRSQAGGNSVPCVLCLNPWDCQSKRVFEPDGLYPTLPAMDSGGRNNQAVLYDTTQITSPVNRSNPQPGDPSHPLCASSHAPLLIEPSVCNESGHGYWMPGFGCLRAEGENRPSRPCHLVCFAQNQRDEVRSLGEHTGA